MDIQTRKKEKGFSLIEMMVATMILAILVVIAVYALSTAKTDAKTVKLDNMIQRIEGAKISYYLDTRNSEAPTLIELAPYMNCEGGGEEIFYTEAAWNNANPGDSRPKTGYLFENLIKQSIPVTVSPNARDIKPTLQYGG